MLQEFQDDLEKFCPPANGRRTLSNALQAAEGLWFFLPAGKRRILDEFLREFDLPAGRTGDVRSKVAVTRGEADRHDGDADRRRRHLHSLPVPCARVPRHLGIRRRPFKGVHRPAAVRAQRDRQLPHPSQLIRQHRPVLLLRAQVSPSVPGAVLSVLRGGATRREKTNSL